MTEAQPETHGPMAQVGRALRFLFAPRMAVWLYLSIALLIGVWWFAAHMLKVILYKVVILTIAGFVGDKIGRGMESSNPRPHELLDAAVAQRAMSSGFDLALGVVQSHLEYARDLERRADQAYLRRAIVIAAAMIAAALGT